MPEQETAAHLDADPKEAQPAYLIINADDYGYFNCVSRGILDCADQGRVTATGIFANSPRLEEHVAWLESMPALDLGVHLNLTDRRPLTRGMSKCLQSSGGAFVGKFVTAKAVLTGSIRTNLVKDEWREQIERCLKANVEPCFLNSHEHIHMLTNLYPIILELADEYGIQHVRHSTPEWPPMWSPGAVLRDGIMAMLSAVNRRDGRPKGLHFLGMGQSGHLSSDYLKRTLPKLRSGEIYELMCHPGYNDRTEIQDVRLLNYHDWDRERTALCEPALNILLEANNIELIGYRALDTQGSTIAVSQGRKSQ